MSIPYRQAFGNLRMDNGSFVSMEACFKNETPATDMCLPRNCLDRKARQLVPSRVSNKSLLLFSNLYDPCEVLHLSDITSEVERQLWFRLSLIPGLGGEARCLVENIFPHTAHPNPSKPQDGRLSMSEKLANSSVTDSLVHDGILRSIWRQP